MCFERNDIKLQNIVFKILFILLKYSNNSIHYSISCGKGGLERHC
jgi:hypothetical protein